MMGQGQTLYIFTICLQPHCWWVLKGASILLQLHYENVTHPPLTIPIFLLTALLSCILPGKADMMCISFAKTLDLTAIFVACTTSI